MERDLFDETSDVFESGQFIVLTSQVDSQPGPILDLPALQQVEEESGDSEIVYPVMEPSAAQPGSLVLVTDSEVEAVEKPGTSSDACVIGETASEDNMEQAGGATSSDDAGNVTVIVREVAAQGQEDDPMSQDLFAPKEDKEDHPVATPSHHLASLQLSGQPMLVPETLEESLGDQEICPSPDAYGDMPHIIPSTPSLTTGGEGAETEYNPGELQTLNSQQGKTRRKPSPELQSQTDSQKQASAGASASVSMAEGPMLPTLAEDLPEWQQSQSLCLLMTSSSSNTSQRPSQHQVGQMQSQLRTDSQASIQSQGVKSENIFATSQNQRVGPILSQNSGQQVSEAFSLSVPHPASGSQSKRTEKAETEATNNSSSKESSAEVSVSWGTTTKAAISIDMVHSQSQSASETTFKLERPDVSVGEKRTETEEGSSSQNIFQRTRQSKRIAAAKQASGLSEDSEDVFANIGKAAEVQQSPSDSDPIPCSQNRPALREPLKQEEKMETVGEESEPPGDIADVYNVDTVMDSEPEDEGTQSYEVFPALSRNSSQSVMVPAGETEEAQVPELLPSIAAASPTEEPLREVAPSHPDQQAIQTQPFNQRASQVAARLAQLSALSEETAVSALQQSLPAGQRKPASQPARVSSQPPASQPRLSSQPVRTKTSVADRRAGNQTTSQGALNQTVEGSMGDVSAETSRPGNVRISDPGGVGKDDGQPVPEGKGILSSTARREVQEKGVPRRQLVHPVPDPYTFRSSQSQLLMEVDGTSTSRAETSVSTARALKNKPKGLVGRRRKLLVKKKNEANPRGEMKSSSTDDGTGSKPIVRPARRTRKGETFTRLQQTVAEDFKIPEPSAHDSSTRKDNAEVMREVNPTDPLVIQRQSTVPVAAASGKTVTSSSPSCEPQPVERLEPQPSTSRAKEETGGEGDSQDSQKMRKRKSVEFGSVVQIDSPALPLSLEQSLSDSQSSDTLLEVTEVTDFIMRLVKRRIVVRKIDKDGNIVHEKTSVKEGEPVLVEEINHTSKRRVALSLSPSRSGSTLESGDLADISSSSLSNKASSGHSSLERGISSLELPPPAPLSSAIPLEAAGNSTAQNASSTSRARTSTPWRLSGEQTAPASLIENIDAPAGEHSLGGRSSTGVSPAISFLSPDQSAIERDDSRLEAVVTSSSSGLASEALYSADNKQTSSDVPCAQQPPQATSSSSSSGVVPPTNDENSQPKQQLRSTTRSTRKATHRAAADSSQEESQRSTKVTSSPESQSFLPGNESGGFSVVMSGARKRSQGSGASGTNSGKTGHTSVASPKKTSHVRQQTSQETSERDTTPVQVLTASKLEIGARVMCRWKDGFFYPAKFVGLNTGIGNKFKVLFEDGLEKMVRAVDLVMAQNLPLGQSVLVTGEDGISDPGIVIKHVLDDPQAAEKGEAVYDVAMDDGSTRRCRRSQLILSEDQASCLLSDEEYRATLGETDLSLVNTADVSLDNVIQGKRLRTKGSPAVGVPRIVSKASTSSVPSDDEHTGGDSSSKKKAPTASSTRAGQSHDVQQTPRNEKTPTETASTSKSSSRKRKTGSVATSTPIPKRVKTSDRQRTPRKAVQEGYSPLGGAVASPEATKRPTRKARIGLFENVKGPIPSNPTLFKGYVFLLTHVSKTPDLLAEEKRQLQSSSMDTSAEESTDEGSNTTVIPFDKDHLTAQIEAGGGIVLSKLRPSSLTGAGKKLFLLSGTFQRTVKYLQCLAANLPAVSHTWITHSCTQNQLLDYKSYVLPAGISLEKHAILERTTVSCLVGQRVLLTSSVAGFLEAWTSVLELAQCKILSKFAGNATGNRSGVDVVVTDHTCVKSIEDKARQLGVPVVGTEWVVQCLINNSLMQHDAHPKYNHTYFKFVAKSSQDTD